MQWVDTVRQIRNPLFLRYKALPSLSPPPFFGFVLPLSATSRQYFLRTNQPAQVKSTCRLVLFSRIRTNHSEIGIYCCCCVVIVSSFLLFFFFSNPFRYDQRFNRGYYQLWLDDYPWRGETDSKRVTFSSFFVISQPDTIDRVIVEQLRFVSFRIERRRLIIYENFFFFYPKCK